MPRRTGWPAASGRATSAARSASRKGIKSGTVSINSNETIHTEAPFGGYKMSGLGRELGMHALDEYTEVKNVFVDLADWRRREVLTDLAAVERLLPEWRELAATSARSALEAPDWQLPLAHAAISPATEFDFWRGARGSSWSASRRCR